MKISQKNKKKIGINPSFLHKGFKKSVEQEYDIYSDQTLATKIRNSFFLLKTAIFALKTVYFKYFQNFL